MKYYPKLNVYKNSNGNCLFIPNEVTAYSYGWWCFVKVINGEVIFNNFKYSQTTSRHQSKVRQLLDKLGIRIDKIITQRESL